MSSSVSSDDSTTVHLGIKDGKSFVKYQPSSTKVVNIRYYDTENWMAKCKCAHHQAVERFCPLRSANLCNASERYQTFRKLHWLGSPDVNLTDLAEAGFYYTGESDIVRCFHCDVAMNGWKKGDNPAMDHIKYSRFCGFTLGYKSVGNVPILDDPYKDLLPEGGMDVVD